MCVFYVNTIGYILEILIQGDTKTEIEIEPQELAFEKTITQMINF